MATLATYCSILTPLTGTAQSGKLHDYNSIGWYQLNLTTNLGPKWGLHVDYNQRYEPLQKELFQRLIRAGVNFKPSSAWHFRTGYAWVENIPYGNFPSNSEGLKSNEHRLYQMIAYKHLAGNIEFRHRVMTEQRWLERTPTAGSKNSSYLYANRVRYQLKTQIPIKRKADQQRYPFVQLQNELMVAYGKNVPDNHFDQNRVSLLAGYHFSKQLQLEAGIIHIRQLLQRKINDQSVLLHNTGLQINLYAQLNPTKKATAK